MERLSSGGRVGGSSWRWLRELTRWRHFFNGSRFAFGFCQKSMFQESWSKTHSVNAKNEHLFMSVAPSTPTPAELPDSDIHKSPWRWLSTRPKAALCQESFLERECREHRLMRKPEQHLGPGLEAAPGRRGSPAPWVQVPMCTQEEDQSQLPCGFSVGFSGPRPWEDRAGEGGSWDRAARGSWEGHEGPSAWHQGNLAGPLQEGRQPSHGPMGRRNQHAGLSYLGQDLFGMPHVANS